jgi:hypothetical protein
MAVLCPLRKSGAARYRRKAGVGKPETAKLFVNPRWVTTSGKSEPRTDWCWVRICVFSGKYIEFLQETHRKGKGRFTASFSFCLLDDFSVFVQLAFTILPYHFAAYGVSKHLQLELAGTEFLQELFRRNISLNSILIIIHRSTFPLTGRFCTLGGSSR